MPARPTTSRGAPLAAMLGYYRQEGKNAWWEFFRLRDLPKDEHLDEREMLGGLEFVEQLPKRGRERSPRCRFRFPAQETAIDIGASVVRPVIAGLRLEPETARGTVEASISPTGRSCSASATRR